MQYDDSILDAKFRQLSTEMQLALTSAQMAENVKSVGDRYGLHVDQEGVLFNQVAYIMLGLIPSKEFVNNFSKEANVDEETARDIANDLNKEVFDKVRSSMQAVENNATKAINTQNDMAALERVGGFSVEPTLASESADGQIQGNWKNESEVSVSDKNSILSGIEDPKPAVTRTEENHYEPLVDHLLGTTSAQMEQKVEHKTEEPPANLPVIETDEEKALGTDMPVVAAPTEAPKVPEKPAVPAPIAKKAVVVPPRPAGTDPYRETF